MKREQSKTIAIVVLAVALVLALQLKISPSPQAGVAGDIPASDVVPMAVVQSEPVSQTGAEPAAVDLADAQSLETEQEPEPETGAAEEVSPELPQDNISLEIERKFLVALEDLPEDMQSIAHSYTIEQTYLSIQPEIRLRRINGGTQYWYAVKLPKDETGLARAEMDFMVSADVYHSLVDMMMGETVHKTRYQFEEAGVMVFVDVYGGRLEGLAVAEVEFESGQEADAFVPPAWFGADVTADKRYKNAQLAMNGLPDPRVLEEE